jgi:alkanesulfonate monooxygenase SsuD/methylene tetrahydromethanopterin reductase-like flavin-dependent oxidoreductase (luciferase family)
MKSGLVLPASLPGVDGRLILGWARAADVGPFTSVSVFDRLVYANYEPLATLAAVAAVTERVRLMTSVVLAPLRPPALLAKMASSIDALSAGRLSLGLGLGGRHDDFRAAGVARERRAGRWGDGFLSGLTSPARALSLYQQAQTSWAEAGRPGKPRFVGGFPFPPGSPRARARRSLSHSVLRAGWSGPGTVPPCDRSSRPAGHRGAPASWHG